MTRAHEQVEDRNPISLRQALTVGAFHRRKPATTKS